MPSPCEENDRDFSFILPAVGLVRFFSGNP